MTLDSPYNKTNPFLSAVVERYNLCAKGSDKNIYHVSLDLKGSGLTYKVGDSIAVQPVNDPQLVEQTLKSIKADKNDIITDKQGVQYSLEEFLSKKCDLSSVSRKFIMEMAKRQSDLQKKERLEWVISEGQKDVFKEYQHSHELWDALLENEEVTFSPQEFCLLIQPLLPRFYSIASSMAVAKDTIDLTVAELVYETNHYIRRGVCTHYLCQLAPLNQKVVPIYIHPSNGFTLPENNSAPIIMVGPGTGVAPFRGFMQERAMGSGKGVNWLFFGERHRALNYLYEDFWEPLIEKKILRMETAFSRDQEHKIYVQHRLMEHGEQVFSLLEQGGYFYVCGDAHRMAKDVDAALHQIIQMHGKCQEREAKDYVKKLKAEKRYLRDVY